MTFTAKWIKPKRDFEDVCPTFVKKFGAKINGERALLTVTSLGVYEAVLNGKRISDYVLAPGWTADKRLQYQTYDVTDFLRGENTDENILEITVGRGWYRSHLGWVATEGKTERELQSPGLIAQLSIGDTLCVKTDASWQVQESTVRFSEIYDGEHQDATITDTPLEAVEEYPGPDRILVLQQGEVIREIDRMAPAALITTPKGETVIDFGQNITGYVEFNLPPSTISGGRIEMSCAEVLDSDGNFYTENYRTAKSKFSYICRDGAQSCKPKFTFFGFRYIRLDEYPSAVDLDCIAALVVHSDIKRTGRISSSNQLLNRFFENVVWGQKGNFLDVPTDCPQRDEKLGWTGDAQAFVKAASYNFDVERFFTKWLADMALDQKENGIIPYVIPDVLHDGNVSTAWADAVTICPWQIYLTYGNKEILEHQFESMNKWVDYITAHTHDKYLWTGRKHLGDWLSLEKLEHQSPENCSESASRHDFIASAFYAYSTQLLVKAGKVLERDVTKYVALYENILSTFRKTYTEYHSQTEYVLALQFGLAENPQLIADAFAKKLVSDGSHLKTGFVGTPYLLHVLSNYGHTDLAYTLLLRKEYPSWLYPVTKGATTIWERWDSIKVDGSMQSTGMNSFNHYAYGAAADWLYEVAAGIQTVESAPGFAKILIAPQPDKRLEWLCASIETRRGLVSSKWQYINGSVRYDIETPSPTEVRINGKVYFVDKGNHTFFG